MSNPFAGLSIPSPPVVNAGGQGGLNMDLIMQILAQAQARRMRQAENTVGAIEPGRTVSSLNPQQLKALKRARGKGVDPNAVVNPLEGEEGELSRTMQRLGINPGSSLWEGFMTARGARLATGSPHAMTTRQGLADEQAATVTQAETGKIVSGVGNRQAKNLASAQYKIEAGKVDAKEGGLNQAEILAYQRFNDITPSEGMAKSLEGSTRSAVMKEALRIANDPDSATWASLMPEGVKPADIIGGIALGVGPMMLEGFQQQGQKELARINRASESEKALFGVAETVSKAMGGRYTPDFIVDVMEGGKSVGTPAGMMVARFLDAGFYAGLMDASMKGDPGAMAMKTLLEVAHIPQIAGNNKLLANYSNLLREQLAASITRSFLGVERPSEKGAEQQSWDQANAAIAKQMGGVFSSNWITGLTVQQRPVGVSEEQESQEKDQELARQTIEALYGPLGALEVKKKGAPRVLGKMKEVTGAK